MSLRRKRCVVCGERAVATLGTRGGTYRLCRDHFVKLGEALLRQIGRQP